MKRLFSSDYLRLINLFRCFPVKRLMKRLFSSDYLASHQPFSLFFGKKADETPVFK